MGRCLTAAQKQRQRRRLRSIKKQQSTGRTVNTDRYETWGQTRGTRNTPKAIEETSGPSRPDEVFCVMDTTYPSARDTTEVYGELLDGVVVLRMEYDEEDECECCRREGGYHITGLGCYSAFCREHLAEHPGVFRVVESEEELADIGMKPVEVTR